MGFVTNYNVGGELDKVKYIDEIKNFAQLSQPYNKMTTITIPAMMGKYELEYESPDKDAELIALVVTCSGYGEEDYYNLYVNDELWFETWYPTEVKEGLYIGTSTYVYKLDPKTKFRLEFHNVSGTSKKVWMGIRMLVEKGFDKEPIEEDIITPVIPTDA
jgi:hypothetical protein